MDQGSKENALYQLMTGEAVDAGFGKGELSGLVANLRAFMVIIAAPIFGQISMVGRRHNFPGGHLVAIAACTAVAELVFRTVKRVGAKSATGSPDAKKPIA